MNTQITIAAPSKTPIATQRILSALETAYPGVQIRVEDSKNGEYQCVSCSILPRDRVTVEGDVDFDPEEAMMSRVAHVIQQAVGIGS